MLEAKKLKVGAGGTASLTAKEQVIYDQGLVGTLKSLHDDLDAAVLAAYGWEDDPTDEQLLERLVALNEKRAAEEAQGHIRWLRPAFQNPRGAPSAGPGVFRPTICDSHEEGEMPPAPPAPAAPWPQSLPE